MKLTTGILAVGLMTGGAWAQNPNIIQNVQGTMNTVQQQKTNDSNAALGIKNTPAPNQAAKPTPAAPAKPGTSSTAPATAASKSSTTAPSQAAAAQSKTASGKPTAQAEAPAKNTAGKPAATSATPAQSASAKNASARTTPAKNIPAKPATTAVPAATAQAKGWPAKPATSTPVPAAQARNVPAKPAVTPAVVSSKTSATAVTVSVKQNSATAAPANSGPFVAKAPAMPAVAFAPNKTPAVTAAVAIKEPGAKKGVQKSENTTVAADTKSADAKVQVKTVAETKSADAAKLDEAAKTQKPEEKKPEEKKWAMNGKRDPFFSPVVTQPTGSGCSSGKKCLEIGQINLRGVVKADTGYIAVVTNSLNKAYFLHENDPVFNGFVVRITGDAVVFQETYEDKLGKPLTREVVKHITTPAV
jgi:hypothetical protein